MVSQSDSLKQTLIDDIGTHGPLPLSVFMERALRHYYGTRDPLGAEGDFTTAPEISQMFGEMIGLWLVVMWQTMGSPDSFVLAELGPGRGTLMADILRAARVSPDFLNAVQIWLVETSPVLKAIQKHKLRSHPVHWVNAVEQIPGGPILVVANEFFDALPVEQSIARDGQWRQRCVSYDAGTGFFGVDGEPLGPSGDAPDGSVDETSPLSLEIVRLLGLRIARAGGALLIIDYGHGISQWGDTVQAVKKHRFCSVFEDPGEADITAHVDFHALAEAAIPARSHGPVEQGAFLTQLGIVKRAQLLGIGKKDEVAKSLMTGMTRLVDNAEMGRLFKVMAVTHPAYPLPPGFNL